MEEEEEGGGGRGGGHVATQGEVLVGQPQLLVSHRLVLPGICIEITKMPPPQGSGHLQSTTVHQSSFIQTCLNPPEGFRILMIWSIRLSPFASFLNLS